jgi:mannose-6-phosphate isomerase-like protein (cupin superfamily)
MIAQRRRAENPRFLGLCGGHAGASLDRMNTPTAVSDATVSHDGEGEELLVRGTRILVKAATPAVTVTDHTIPAGFPGPPLHVHPALDEVFLVLEGTLSIRVGEEVEEIAPGGTAFVGGAMPHTFANASEAPTRFMVASTPGGFEQYFRAMAAGDEDASAEALARFGYEPFPAV